MRVMNSLLVRIGSNDTFRADDILAIENVMHEENSWGFRVTIRGIQEPICIYCDDAEESDDWYAKAIVDWESALTGAHTTVIA